MIIIYPVQEEKKLWRGCLEHQQQSGLGCAVDLKAEYWNLYAPIEGICYLFSESKGGDWIGITDNENKKWEMAHLSERYVGQGQKVKGGQLIGKTGNSGIITTGPHLHLQIRKGSTRIDPWPLLINASMPMEGKFIRNQKDGFFAFIRNGKKMIVKMERAGLAALTAIQRKSEIINVTEEIWNSLPNGENF